VPDSDAILYKPDPETKPDRYAIIYVGHFDNLAEEGFPFKHPRAHCWAKRAGSRWTVHTPPLRSLAGRDPTGR
jgi:hypothetical protein